MTINNTQIFRLLFFILLSATLLIRVYYAYQVRRQGSRSTLSQQAVHREGMLQTALRLTDFLGGVGAITLCVISPTWITLFNLPLPAWLRWLGFVIGILDLPLLIWVHHTLGRQWSTSLELQQRHQLVITGPYRWARHPMYAVLFASFIALSLVSANLIVAIPFILGIVFIYSRIDTEEAMMIERFGDEYRTYMARTGRLLLRWR